MHHDTNESKREPEFLFKSYEPANPPNKKIEQQRKFSKINDKPKKNKLKLCKPTQQYTKDLLLSAVRNDSFLTSDNNRENSFSVL